MTSTLITMYNRLDVSLASCVPNKNTYKLASVTCLNSTFHICAIESWNFPSCVCVNQVIMTVLLKNLFTVHFQFDLLKLETNNTRDDELKHAWIIARWTAGWWDLSLTTVATSWVEPSFSLTPEHAIWTGPPILPTPTPNPLCLHKTTICNNFSMHSKWWL